MVRSIPCCFHTQIESRFSLVNWNFAWADAWKSESEVLSIIPRVYPAGKWSLKSVFWGFNILSDITIGWQSTWDVTWSGCDWYKLLFDDVIELSFSSYSMGGSISQITSACSTSKIKNKLTPTRKSTYWQIAKAGKNLPWDMISSPTPLKSSPAQNLSSPTPICSIFLARTVWTDLPAQQTTRKSPSLAVCILKSTIWLSWMKSHEMRSASSQWPDENRKTRRSVPGSWTGHRRFRRAGSRSSPGDP